jgi:chemotaxis protein MotA
MNLPLILGIGVMWTLVALACGITRGTLGAFIDIPSIQIVILGTLAGGFASFPLSVTSKIPTTLMIAIFDKKGTSPIETIKLLVEFAEKARKEGILGLENSANKVTDEFLKKGLNLAVDGTEPELIRKILRTDIMGIESRHASNVAIYDYMGGLAPAMGMLGTFVGLVLMLGNLTDVESLGPNMAIAIITSFYGAMIANCMCYPIMNVLNKKSAAEVMVKNIMVEGIMAIQAGDNPRIVEQKLAAALDPVSRTKVVKQR